MRVLVPFILPATFLSALAAGSEVALFAPALVLFVGVPLADAMLGDDLASPRTDDRGTRLRLAVVALYVPMHVACLVLGIGVAAAGASAVTLLGLALSLGAIGSIGITASHELVHKTDRAAKLVGRVGLAAVGYVHFEVQHVHGHHRYACTKEDESTAWFGESLYAFVARTVPRSFREAWRIECRLLRQDGRGRWALGNRVLWSVVSTVTVCACTFHIGGPAGVAVFLVSASIAVFLLESVAYVEHYGLERRTDSSGRPEKMTHLHSWEAYGAASSAMTFMLQRHADHHLRASRPFCQLGVHPGAPRLPAGYPTMIAVAMIPPLWRGLIHRRLEAIRAGA